MPKPVQHSYSAVTLFETCPKKYYHERVKRDYKDTGTNPVQQYGLEGHKAFENRLLKDKKLPLDLMHHEEVMAKIAAAPGEGMPEQKLAINREFKPTGYFDSDVWVRCVIDYVKYNGATAFVLDHKFGKMKNDFSQIELCAAMLNCFMPDLKNFRVAFYWAKDRKLTSKKLASIEMPLIWEGMMSRFERIELAHKHDEFPAKQNGLCKRYCPVLSCPHNGRQK